MSSRIVKAKLGEDLRRVTVQAGTDIAQLRSTLSLLFSVPSSSHTLKLRYADEEGDLITLSSDIELQEALSALPPGAILKLDLELVPSSSSSFSSSSSSSTPLSPLPPFSPFSPSSSFLSSPTIPLPSSVASSIHLEEQPAHLEEEEEREKEQEQEQQQEEHEQEEHEQEEHEQEEHEQEKGKQPAVEENGEELPPYQTEEEEEKKKEKKKEKEREREEDRGVDLHFLLNEFHYHRLIFQTACKAAFESLAHEYEEHHKAKIQEMWTTAKLQSSLLANTIEETFDEWKKEVRTSPSAQEFSTRVSEALKGVETFTAPVIESIRVALLNLFSSKPPSSLTSSQIVREMETFHFTSPHPPEEPASSSSSSPVPADDVKVIPSDVHTHEESVTGHVGEVPLASALSGEFIYVLAEEENSFPFQDAVAEIVSMGFTDLVAIQAALQAHNGDVNGAVNSLL